MKNLVHIYRFYPNHTIITAEAQDLEIKKDERQEVCKGGPYDQWENQASPCEKTCCKPQSGLCNFVSIFNI